MVDVMTPLVSVKQLGEASINSVALLLIFEWDWDDAMSGGSGMG
jgi:hypothetical protein